MLRAWAADPVALWSPRLLPLARTQSPQRGDVGIVRHEGVAQGALCLGGGLWAGPGSMGVGVYAPGVVIAAWSVGYAEG